MAITNTTSLQDLFDQAITTLSDVNSDEKFIVKELFRGFEWNRISKGNRTKLGSMFFNYANTKGSNIIHPLGKTPQNQQIYIKL
ncbi:DUF1413 domain-containing protein [Clostridium perfringens]|uniref:DUF1413 domain-containing protein n=1 Tax=Clostridium perfringens TaxID=1502 RepID=UPI0018E405FE|nr:DUF1413 domain-containing protein [Clostridium perfringens]MBI6104896.1 single-stranded DNA-binding protein [Clostridium perfringens]MDK0751692.1 DUF1413 domain-containing protein [Clostridium perfringens]MDK0982649.1 DUF1413 domain-containing protein [Clostridium perfringens]MDM0925932.1 DUF1413 domain-containing protein [Clostridium perfringens]MDM0963019.1 DUF1413 domain-containing protein [Clostridium perfringens]